MNTKSKNNRLWRFIVRGLSKIWTSPSWLVSGAIINDDVFRKAKLLSKIVVSSLFTNTLGLTLALLEPKNKLLTTVSFYGMVYLVLIGFLVLLNFGKLKIASWSLVGFMWAILAFATLFFGGLHTQVPAVFVVAIMLMGSLFGGRAAFFLSLFTILFLGLVALLESSNLMPPQLGPDYSPLNAWSGLCIALLLMSVLLESSLSSVKESELRYQLAVSGTSAGLWDWDIDTNDVYYAPGFKRMLGYSIAEFPNRFSSLIDALHPDDINYARKLLDAHLESSQNRYDAEFRLRTKKGDYQWFHSRGVAVRDQHERPYRMVGSIINITKRKLAEESIVQKNEELVKINEELDRFVYSASHDLRAPILSMMGLIKLARLEKTPDSVMRLLDMQERSLMKLDKFIFDIVNYSRNNRVDIEITEINFRTLIDDTFEQLQHMEQVIAIRQIIEIDQNVKFYGDERRLMVVLNNLISNAIKYNDYTKADPFVKISVKKLGDRVSIHVEDSGEGIEHEKIPRIFDMFYRGSERSVGSGIGLYIVKEVVEKLRGDIKVHSKKWQGSEFIVSIPNVAEV